MPKALKRKDKNGVPFARPREIEAWLQRLESVDAAARLQVFADASRKSDGYVPSEALTYFLRHAHIARRQLYDLHSLFDPGTSNEIDQ